MNTSAPMDCHWDAMNALETRWYPWGIQSPHTSTATGGEGVLGKLRFEIRERKLEFFIFRRGEGVFWVSSDLNSGKKVRVFHFGVGMFWVNSDLNSGKKVRVFHFQGGMVLGSLDLDSGNNFNWGGCSGTKF